MLKKNSGLFLDASDPAWCDFIAADPHANIFHHPAWIETLAESYGYRPFILATRDQEGLIRAGLPFMEVNSPVTGKRWVSLPFSDHCQPLGEDNQALEELTEAIILLSQDGRTPRMELRGDFPADPAIHPFSEHVIHIISLAADVGKVLGNLHPMHRRNVKIAQSNGVQVTWGETRTHLDDYYNLHVLTRRRQGVPVQPKRFFERLGKLILNQDLGFLLLAYKDRQCISGAIFLHWGTTLTYKYGASCAEGQQLRANNGIMWTTIQWGCENGFSQLDLGRTSNANTGLRTYKSRWGARESPLFYARLKGKAGTSEDGKLMSLMQTVLQKSPPWICRATGELLYRHFG